MAVVSPDRLLGLPPREQGRGSTVREIRQAYGRKVEELELLNNLRTPPAIKGNFPRLHAFLALKNAALYAFLDAAQRSSYEESKGEGAADADADVTMDDMNVKTGDIVPMARDVAMEDVMREADKFMADLEKTFSAIKLI